ncbi:NUDIX hydrolase [Saccharomonospora iraqiensis]|uniref:NUDIX hydrolase n=1 Tax=Saccharomonospora iraqiensis TaxID=52698 RepID=UPI00047C075B|nr:NUDIX domain-containing protein [Saccharomonospora iraqiensis]
MTDRTLLSRLTAEADLDGVQQLVVGGVVQHDGKVLLLQRPEGDFMGSIVELPSGKVEAGESLDAALIREVREETGLDVTAVRDYLGSFDYVGGSGRRSRQFNFAVEVRVPEPIELREHDAYTWTALVEDPPVTDAVKDVLSTYREVVNT